MKPFLSRAALATGGVITACLLLEMTVRALDVLPSPLAPLPIPNYRLSDNPVIRYEYQPGHRATDEPFDESHRGFQINSAGFRDREYEERKPAGVRRVIVLGDSTTAGNGVAVEDTYPKQLEALLNGRQGAAPRYEVLNMGVGGYQTLQEVETLRVKGLRFAPDLVLVTTNVTDLFPEADGGVYESLLHRNRLSGAGPDGGPLSRVLRLSRLAFIVYHRLGFARTAHTRRYEEGVLGGRTPVRAGLELLSELQQQHGFAACVLALPEFSSPFGWYRSPAFHRHVREAAAGLPGLAVFDLLPAFVRLGGDADRYSYDGLHLSEEGHRAVADILLPLVRRAEAWPGGPGRAAAPP